MIVACTDAQEVPQEFFAVCDGVFRDEGRRGGLSFSTGTRGDEKIGRRCRQGQTHTCHTEIKRDEQTRHMKGWLNFRLSAITARGWKRKWRMFCRVLAHSPPWPLSRKEKPKKKKRRTEWMTNLTLRYLPAKLPVGVSEDSVHSESKSAEKNTHAHNTHGQRVNLSDWPPTP